MYADMFMTQQKNDGVAFEDLADDYTCPVCGVGKENFSEE